MHDLSAGIHWLADNLAVVESTGVVLCVLILIACGYVIFDAYREP